MSQAQQAFKQLLSVLEQSPQHFEAMAEQSDIDLAGNYRNIIDLASVAFDCYVQNDPAFPRWVSLVSGHRKIGGDNQHARYYFVPVSSQYRYRVRGAMEGALYMGFTVYGCESEDSFHIVANTNNTEIKLSPNGEFELELSADGGDQPNSIGLAPLSNCLIVRQYFDTAAPDQAIPLTIEVQGAPTRPPLLSSEEMARRIQAAANFLQGWLKLTPMPWPQEDAAYNVICPPLQASASTGHWSTPDNIHAMGFYRLEQDQALVLRGNITRSRYWSCHLWNPCMQTYDYDNYQCALSGNQLAVDENGEWQIVIANCSPRGKHWIDTSGHDRGFVYFRWLQAAAMPGEISAELVPLETLN